jgi:pimeloyl-ACP methyl ester carboxylesterase
MIIETPNFKLAAYTSGSPDAPKVALVLPGFLDTKDHPHMRSHVDTLAGQGYFALSFDPPGTWGSAGLIADYTMTNWLRAVQEVQSKLGNRPTFAVGHSRGGSMAMLAAIRCPEVFAFASVMSKASYAPGTPTTLPLSEWKRDGFKMFHVTIPGHPGQKRDFSVPYSVMEDLEHYNMLSDLSRLEKPKLFIEGSTDTTVSPQTVQTGYEAAAQPKELYRVNSDHMYRRRPQIIEEINRALVHFLLVAESNLPAVSRTVL